MPNGAKWFDNTLKAEGISEDRLIQFFESQPDIDRWCFERETGETTGYEHYQIRYVLKEKKELRAEITRWSSEFGADHIHLSVLGMAHPNWDYVQKDGKYTASWEYKSPLNRFKNLTLRPWQYETVGRLGQQNERTVMCIVDIDGNNGKTYLRKFMQANKICAYIPEMHDMKDMMRIAMNKYEACKINGFCFDLPRADGDKKNTEMWKAIEEIKNGYLYDDRYHFREMWIDSPRILVFTNDYPDTSVLSRDRWQIFSLNDGVEGTYLQPIDVD